MGIILGDMFSRLGKVNPLVWVALVLAGVLGYGAQKWVNLMKIPEEKQQKAVLIIKGAALALVVLVFILVTTTY
jgi:hypothetical protein